MQDSAVGAVELGHGGEKEGQRHILRKVGMGARSELEGARGGRTFDLFGSVADVGVGLDAFVADTVGEEEEVGGEGKRPGPRHGWESEGWLVT